MTAEQPGIPIQVAIEDIPEGRPLRVKVYSRGILFCKEGDTIAVFEDRCPHQGMSMRHGVVLNGKLVCPYHRYQFDLDDGSANIRKCSAALQVPFTVEDGVVHVLYTGPEQLPMMERSYD